jgi:hypothetical protein
LKDWLKTEKKILKAVSLSVGLCSYSLWGSGLRLERWRPRVATGVSDYI